MNPSIEEIVNTMPGKEWANQLKQLPNSWEDHQIKILLRSKGYCEYCGTDIMASPDSFWAAQWDHIVPSAKGGECENKNAINKKPIREVFQFNIAHCCKKCNSVKTDRLPDNIEFKDLASKSPEERIKTLKSWVIGLRENKRIEQEYHIARQLMALIR